MPTSASSRRACIRSRVRVCRPTRAACCQWLAVTFCKAAAVADAQAAVAPRKLGDRGRIYRDGGTILPRPSRRTSLPRPSRRLNPPTSSAGASVLARGLGVVVVANVATVAEPSSSSCCNRVVVVSVASFRRGRQLLAKTS